MGCDIHLHVEIKVDGEWLHYNHPDIDRNYSLFWKMAGVRDRGNDEEPLAVGRGVPDDASKPTWLDYRQWGDDAHSASYLNQEEIKKLKAWYDENIQGTFAFYNDFGFLFGNGFDIPKEQEEWLEDVRFVFWFDN